MVCNYSAFNPASSLIMYTWKFPGLYRRSPRFNSIKSDSNSFTILLWLYHGQHTKPVLLSSSWPLCFDISDHWELGSIGPKTYSLRQIELPHTELSTSYENALNHINMVKAAVPYDPASYCLAHCVECFHFLLQTGTIWWDIWVEWKYDEREEGEK